MFYLSWFQYSSYYYKSNVKKYIIPSTTDQLTTDTLTTTKKESSSPFWNLAKLEEQIKNFKFKMKQKAKEEKDENKYVVPDGMIEILNKLDRIVHIDLKGAPPKPEYFKEFIPLIKKYGATGILLEYEDMFPYTGVLKVVRHGNAYSKADIKLILKLAKDNDLTVMPLVQTYGHLEWLLKHKNFAHLREEPEYPQGK